MNERDRILSEAPLTDTSPTRTGADHRAGADAAFYDAWASLLEWMREYAEGHDGVILEKEADFPDYIYRMERPYELPTTVMSASLSDLKGRPLLLVNASPRHTVFKEVVLHPFDSHTYRKLSYSPKRGGLTEGKRRFTREMLFELADALRSSDAEPAE